jgi:hypothetical protein
VVVGMTPWQFIADLIQHPPQLIASPWFSVTITVVGLALIGASLWFNVWSRKQQCINALAEDMAWAINNLLNRQLRPTTEEEVARWNEEITAWKRDINSWCTKVSNQLENRAFFSRADQLHFDFLGFVSPVAMTGLDDVDRQLSQLKMKFERLRDVINWTQQRRR